MPALLLFGDTVRNPTLRHELPLVIGDPLAFIESDGRRVVLTSMLERDRIAHVLPDAELLDFNQFGFRELVLDGMTYSEAERETVVRVADELKIKHVLVPADFPLALGDRLRAGGVALEIAEDLIEARRRVKSVSEMEGIRIAQRAAEAGMEAARDLLAHAAPSTDGRLAIAGGTLLAEHVRAAIRTACAEHGAPAPPDIMVGSAWQGYGHDPGEGPLPAGMPIVIDLWPCHEATGCWADMTRTFLVGEPRPEHAQELAARERLVRTALEQARAAIRPGITGRELHEATCDLFEAAGYSTQRTSTEATQTDGFQFALGHGVGLEVHEAPALSRAGRDPLVAGDVVAIEPGLYDDELGGVRFEDLVLVTEQGSETLTQFPYDLAP